MAGHNKPELENVQSFQPADPRNQGLPCTECLLTLMLIAQAVFLLLC